MTRTINHTFDSSNTRHNVARILAVLVKPQTYEELAETICVSHRTMRRYIKHLRADPNRRVRIKSWRGNVPVFALGATKDAVRKPQTEAAKSYKWRVKVKASEELRDRIQQYEKVRWAIKKAKSTPQSWVSALGVRAGSMNAEG